MILRYWIFKKKSYLGYTEKNLDFHLIIPRLSYVSLRPPHCWSLSAKLFRPRRLATHGSNQPMTQNQRAWISIKCWTPQTMQLLLNLRIILHSNLGFFNNRLLKTNRDINQLIMTLWVALKKPRHQRVCHEFYWVFDVKVSRHDFFLHPSLGRLTPSTQSAKLRIVSWELGMTGMTGMTGGSIWVWDWKKVAPSKLVGGFNPFRKKHSSKMGIFPKFSGWASKKNWNHHRSTARCSWPKISGFYLTFFS